MNHRQSTTLLSERGKNSCYSVSEGFIVHTVDDSALSLFSSIIKVSQMKSALPLDV